MPTAPVPANPSSTRLPLIRGASTLKSVSRSRSDVGRKPSHVGESSRRPFNVPPTILIQFRLALLLPDPHQPEPLLPARAHEGDQRGGLLRIVERRNRLA